MQRHFSPILLCLEIQFWESRNGRKPVVWIATLWIWLSHRWGRGHNLNVTNQYISEELYIIYHLELNQYHDQIAKLPLIKIHCLYALFDWEHIGTVFPNCIMQISSPETRIHIDPFQKLAIISINEVRNNRAEDNVLIEPFHVNHSQWIELAFPRTYILHVYRKEKMWLGDIYCSFPIKRDVSVNLRIQPPNISNDKQGLGFLLHRVGCLTYYISRVHGRCLFTMMTSSNGNIFRVTGPLCGEITGHRWIPHTKASDAELSCFLWSAPNKRLSKQWWFKTPSRP